MTLEICMPLYKSAEKIRTPFNALLKQTYKDFYISLFEDTNPECTDDIEKMITVMEEFKSKGLDIRFYYKNERNLKYAGNIKKIFENATGDYFMLLADDDCIAHDAIEKCVTAIQTFDDVGIVANPYYQFMYDIKKPVRTFVSPPSSDIQVSLNSNYEELEKIIHASGQLSTLVFKTEFVKNYPIPDAVFTAHVYPVFEILKHHNGVFLKDPILAVSIKTSQCHTDIYQKSPIQQAVEMYNTFLSDSQYKVIRSQFIKDFAVNNLVGLSQVKNYGTFKELIREIFYYAKYYKRNLLSIRYYFFALGSLIVPKAIVIPLVDWYKNNVLAKRIEKNLKIDFSRFE